jgi:Cu-Zn family superoxide dismutase
MLMPDGIKITGDIAGLRPNTKHGFHIHEFGDCSAKDASSAGSHFNPRNKPHGLPAAPTEAHLGDLGNLQADAQGRAHVDELIPGAKLSEGKEQILGHSIVVHSKVDDLKTQPSGNSGDRMACGVITKLSQKNTETIRQ